MGDNRIVLRWNVWQQLAATLSFVLLLLLPRAALAGGLDIDRPGQREFVVDHADILDRATEREIKRIASELLDDHATSIVVVTIDSMAAHGGERMEIETFARILFDQWGVGHPTVNDQHWDTGILVVISKGDRKARIELGTGWAHEKDEVAREIMQTRMVPAFRDGDYSRGAIDGVVALDTMARSKPLPEPPNPDAWKLYLLLAVMVLLALLVLESMIQNGKQGWGWQLIVLIFALLGALWTLLSWLPSSRRKRSGRRWGSFGGGRSGGGGATGSW